MRYPLSTTLQSCIIRCHQLLCNALSLIIDCWVSLSLANDLSYRVNSSIQFLSLLSTFSTLNPSLEVVAHVPLNLQINATYNTFLPYNWWNYGEPFRSQQCSRISKENQNLENPRERMIPVQKVSKIKTSMTPAVGKTRNPVVTYWLTELFSRKVGKSLTDLLSYFREKSVNHLLSNLLTYWLTE